MQIIIVARYVMTKWIMQVLKVKLKKKYVKFVSKKIKELDLDIKNKEDFIKYVKEKDYKSLKENLLKLDFWFCYYNNEVDDEVIKRFAPSGMSLKNYIELVYERKDKQLQERIDKAIEYIDNQMYEKYCYVGSEDKLKEILKGKSE